MRTAHTSTPDTAGAVWVIYEINAPTNRWIAFQYDTNQQITSTYRGPTFDWALAHTERTRTT